MEEAPLSEIENARPRHLINSEANRPRQCVGEGEGGQEEGVASKTTYLAIL